MSSEESDREFVVQHGTFSALLVPPQDRHYAPHAVLPAHDTVLRPLLRRAEQCWAYGIDRDSDVYRVAAPMLEPKKGKFLVHLDGDPITGRELFWNAQGGRRGTIVLFVPLDAFDATLLRACSGVFVFDNFLSAHTPAAIRFARNEVTARGVVAVCLPRNNGMEWMDIHALPDEAVRLYDLAVRSMSDGR